MKIKTEYTRLLTYALSILTSIFLVFYLFQVAAIKDFLIGIENKTFDLRQNIIVKNKHASQDIAILAIDDASYEYMIDRYGEWPISRSIYADLINYLEKYNPKVIAFDLMFVKSFKKDLDSDKKLGEAISKYDNVFTSMNFDDYEKDVRTPPNLPLALSSNLNNGEIVQNNLSFINCRPIINEILDNTKNVGIINLVRQDDGIARKVPLFVSYQDKFYPHLALLVAQKYLGIEKTSYSIDENRKIYLDQKRFVPLDMDAGAILNWYGPTVGPNRAGTYEHIPFYKIIRAMNDPKKYDEFARKSFENKILYIGTTATSLHDIKSVPVDRLYPGVELHATYVNNIIDNNFIKHASFFVDIVIGALIVLLIAIIVARIPSVILSSASSISIVVLYLIITTYVMGKFNIWLGWVVPVISALTTFIVGYIVKYLLKSRDFEQTYKLATTDGLTELYNHRYFQEQMIVNIQNSKRYNGAFSLLLMDIDHFKKFNDTYGHQAGDAVLRQVAQILKKSVRSSDIVCRYGGEEMVIILTNTQKEEAILTAEKICRAIAQKPFKLGDAQAPVTISIGVSTYPENGENPQQMIEFADKCLYWAKEHGRNQVSSNC